MLGFKLFNNDSKELLNNLFLVAANENLCLEIAVYAKYNDYFSEIVMSDSNYVNNKNKSIHLDYSKYVVNNLQIDDHFSKFNQEISYAKDLLINRGVIHYQHVNDVSRHLPNLEKQQLIKNLSFLYELAIKHNFTFYIENTYIHYRKSSYNNLPFHRVIWDTILELNYQDKIGLCLDWGHVKAFTTEPINAWLNYTRELKAQGMPIYMHIHDNDSVKDLHANFKLSEEKNYPQYNHIEDKPYIEILSNVIDEFSSDSLILEYGSEFAIDNYFWTKNKINI